MSILTEIQKTAANVFKRDLPNAEIHFVLSVHFALESHHTKIAQLMREFLAGVVQ
jgi:hypothetical protein